MCGLILRNGEGLAKTNLLATSFAEVGGGVKINSTVSAEDTRNVLMS